MILARQEGRTAERQEGKAGRQKGRREAGRQEVGIPASAFVLLPSCLVWQDLFANPRTQRFKSPDEIRALLSRAGVGPNQDVVTYCAVGMRASLMAWAAARVAGVPSRVYLGSWQDWARDATNPIIK